MWDMTFNLQYVMAQEAAKTVGAEKAAVRSFSSVRALIQVLIANNIIIMVYNIYNSIAINKYYL